MLEQGQVIELVSDCEALLVPSAIPIMLTAGTVVEVTQYKGGSVTVYVNGNLARISQLNLAALGIKDEMTTKADKEQRVATDKVEPDAIWEALKTVYDPEIPVNIVDLGLIYKVEVDTNEAKTENKVNIEMTLTAPGCGMGPVIVDDAEAKVWNIKNVTAVNIEIVFEPIWDQSMMSDEAKLELGLL